MAGESTKIKVKAVAKLEKYGPGVKKEDIESGKAIPDEIITSDDVLIDPDEETLNTLQNMGFHIPPKAWERAKAKKASNSKKSK